LHPEFGYFCPSPKLRRRLWALLAFLVFGSIVGANGIVSMADHDRDADAKVMVAHTREGPEAQAGRGPAAATALTSGQAGKTVAEKTAPATTAKSDAIAAMAKSDRSRPDASKPESANAACRETTWSFLDGKCAPGNAPKLRVVRVPTNRPAIAAVPLGRIVPPAQAPDPASKSAEVAAADTSVAPPLPAPEASQRPAAASKRPQKSAQARRREQVGRDPTWREVRVPAYGGHPQGPFGFFSMSR
jgi:hypothetical protein